MTPPAGAGARGFTIIETMISMALLAFIVGDLALVSMYASRSGTQAQRLTVATALGQAAIERARNTDFNKLDLPANPATDCFSVASDPVSCGGGGAYYSRRQTVTPSPILQTTVAADVDVVVSWNDERGVGQEYRLATVISRY